MRLSTETVDNAVSTSKPLKFTETPSVGVTIMNPMTMSKLMLLAISASSCAIYTAEQQKQVALISAGVSVNKGLSAKAAILRGNLALEASNASGVGIGVASMLLFNSLDYQKTAASYDHLEAWMPVSEAKDEHEAALLMSQVVENALRKTFTAPYQIKIDEYENIATIGVVDRFRMLRIIGPECENWSCRVLATLPSNTASINEGRMIKYDYPLLGKPCPCYVYAGLAGILGFEKITQEFAEKGVINGVWHRFKTHPIGFGGEDFYTQLSANLPAWVYYYVAKQPPNSTMNAPALFNQGRRIDYNQTF